ncbi:16S rRNA processing protein RimM [Corynebacterium glucuronolyticum ATCC 51867]|nr:16S rRNA processing protein RimM [Corynebacterium glucuronolyticum ATCC 51867]
MATMEYRIGRVVKTHGIKGEVVVDPTTDDLDQRFYVGAVLTGRAGGGKEQQLTIQSMRPHQGRLLVKFEEIPDRTAGESLRGMQFFAPPLEHDPEEDGYYDHELEGLAVIHEGTRVGEVTDITHGPAATLLTVTMDEDERDVLIPLVDAIVPEINLGEKTATITPPDGLLDL